MEGNNVAEGGIIYMLHSVVEYNLLDVTNLLVFSEELCILNDI